MDCRRLGGRRLGDYLADAHLVAAFYHYARGRPHMLKGGNNQPFRRRQLFDGRVGRGTLVAWRVYSAAKTE